MIKLTNNVTGMPVFSGTQKEFVAFAERILIENGDINFSILGYSDAVEYIEDYCDNLDFEMFDENNLKYRFETLKDDIIDSLFEMINKSDYISKHRNEKALNISGLNICNYTEIVINHGRLVFLDADGYEYTINPEEVVTVELINLIEE